ncbi:hypothetical protein LFYK43_11440 [Ligilactobacillus salitolerans]|uniref:Hydrolase n=1 Tax=Ligilactobacillus salitolerans TaxID=1808352 RepID=A0A401IT60_9LACO|nr:hypothetical protein LFYK43_11440 [Ligilactobacillus salitolerans]
MEQIASNDFQLIKDLIAANNLDYIVDDTWNYSARVSPKNKILKQLDPEHFAENISIEEINKPIKIILLNLKPTLFDSLYKMLKNNTSLAIIRHQGENNLDLTATGINKYTTLQRLLPKKEYIAFGNDANDTILLNHAYKSVWVGQLDGANKSGVFQPNFICSPNANSLVSIINRVGSLSEELAREK